MQNIDLVKLMKKTFVIGAGASFEAGLPLGWELLRKIGAMLDFESKEMSIPVEITKGDKDVFLAIQERCVRQSQDIAKYVSAAKHISKTAALNSSIDNLINKNRDNKELEYVAKLSIAKLILAEESGSKLRFKGDRSKTISINSLNDTWYLHFYKMLTERCSSEDLSERFSKITLIIFNYDRCVEHFLFESIKTDYQLNDVEAAAIVDSLSIYHPYGSVGVLPQLELHSESKNVHVEFGQLPLHTKLDQIANGIRTFTEGTDPEDSSIIELRSKLYNSDKVVFLGFGFESLNMELLSPSDKSNPSEYKRPIYATVLGISDDSLRYVTKEISQLFDNKCSINADPITCNELLTKYSHSLSILRE